MTISPVPDSSGATAASAAEVSPVAAGAFAFGPEPRAVSDPSRDFALGVAGFWYRDLYDPSRLAQLDAVFRSRLAELDAPLAERFEAYRNGTELPDLLESELLIDVGGHLSGFVAQLFGVGDSRQALMDAAKDEAVVFRMKDFVARRAAKAVGSVAAIDGVLPELTAAVRVPVARMAGRVVPGGDDELTFARALDVLLSWEARLRPLVEAGPAAGPPAATDLANHVIATLALEGANSGAGEGDAPDDSAQTSAAGLLNLAVALVENALHAFERWAAKVFHDETARGPFAGWVSFRFPHKTDYEHLVPVSRLRGTTPNALTLADLHHARRRDGFGLTDRRMNRRQVANEVDYCLYCHRRDKDSCSHGMAHKDGQLKTNPLGVPLAGCPLEERISEMHVLRKAGDSLGALALITIDNPMVPGTGHRICNDCMKGCIFQKQDPVNIPQAETGVLTDVLGMPHGFEIYALLARWNPLNRRRPFPLPYNGKKVLVVGLGPAGFTLTHHLSTEGFGVVAIDGLKIEPLPSELVGGDAWPPLPVREWGTLGGELDRRVLAGFGGVAEYGITVRWDKNFLNVMHLALARRSNVRLFGGVRFGGTVTLDDAWALGFDHVAIAAGAGRPTVIDLENNLIRGVRKASDFLMALQLTGAYKRDSTANLQVRLPALVIGGGLTGIDTTTEMAAYYPVQVEKFLDLWEQRAALVGHDGLWASYDEEERIVATEFLEHGRAVRAERARAAAVGETPDLPALVRSWGGVSLVYRKSVRDSPAYRLNHEEIAAFLEEGVSFVENLNPRACVPDQYGALCEVVFEEVTEQGDRWVSTGAEVRLPARTLLVAAGTSPNVTYEKEHPGSLEVDLRARAFRSHRAVRQADGGFRLVPATAGEVGFFTSYEHAGRFVTYYGDNHPVYAGSVVKAMASAKHGYRRVAELFADEFARLDASEQPARDESWSAFVGELETQWRAHVHEIVRLTPTIVEVIVRAPAAARAFEPGQFYRLQNFERLAPERAGRRMVMEGLAMTGAWVDKARGLLSFIVLEMGGSSRLVAGLRPGEPVLVMGPTGTATEIPTGESVLLCGGGLGNAVLFSIARALRGAGCRVLYFAGYRRREDIYKAHEIEAHTDQVIWSVDDGELPDVRRPQDRAFRGNIVAAMVAYCGGLLGEARVPLADVHRVIAIGSDRMMAAVKVARHGVLAPYLRPGHTAIASINSPMQCMMKEICAQCLQKWRDPITGKESVVFSCFNQDQPQDLVDWGHLAQRLRQNTVWEKLTAEPPAG